MNSQNLKQFLQLASGDADLKSDLEAAKSKAEVVALGEGRGFAFSEEDLAALDGSMAPNATALREEELEQVAGGAQFGLGGLGVIELTEVETCGTPCCTIEPAFRRRGLPRL